MTLAIEQMKPKMKQQRQTPATKTPTPAGILHALIIERGNIHKMAVNRNVNGVYKPVEEMIAPALFARLWRANRDIKKTEGEVDGRIIFAYDLAPQLERKRRQRERGLS
jgi:hypothetical protein